MMHQIKLFSGGYSTQSIARAQWSNLRGLATHVWALALVFLVYSAEETKAGERVLNEALGFSIELPEGWVRVSADAFYENLGRVRLNDAEFQEKLAKHASLPALAATKHPEPYEDVNPSIKLNVRPYGSLPSKESVEILSLVVGPFKKMFKDLKVVSGPQEVLIDGQRAAHLVVEYTLQSDGGDFPIGSELWIVPRQHFFLMIGVGYKQGEIADASIAKAAVESFRLLEVSQQ